MKFLQAARNRMKEASSNEEGFTLIEIMVAISLLTILFSIIFNSVGGTIMPMAQSSLAHANGLDLKPAQQAAQGIYRSIDAFTHDHPDTAPTQALLTAQGYVNEPSDVVWAFHTVGGPVNRQVCVIAYLSDDSSGEYTASNPAAFDGLYQSGAIWQNCAAPVSSGSTPAPNWNSE